MTFQSDESAKWSQAVNKTIGEWEEETKKLLADSAARGFDEPDGETLAAIAQVGHKAQTVLVEANAKIYGEARERIFEVEDFALKLSVELAKLAMDWYKAKLLNQIALEQAAQDADIQKWRATLIRMDADTEKRNVAIIRLKADIEHEVNQYKKEQIEAEYLTLEAEVALINAKVATAEAKLRIIDYLYEVIEAERLVIAAEKRRAAALELVIEARKRLAEVKKEMIPMYLEKAEARQDEAAATIQEAEIKRQLEELGYERIALKDAEEEADHQVRDANEDYELAQEEYVRWDRAVELLRAQSRRLLQDYKNLIEADILKRRLQLKKDDLDIDLDTVFERKRQDAEADIDIMEHEKKLTRDEFLNRVENIKDVGIDHCRTVRDGAYQVHRSATWSIFCKRVSKGRAYIVAPGGSGVIGDACPPPS